MTVESATYIDTLDPTLPLSGDPKSEGDNHLRLIKQVLQNTFPNINAAVGATDEQLNALQGLTGRTNMIINPHGSIQQETMTPITTATAYFADQWLLGVAGSGFGVQAGVTSDRTVTAFDLSHMWTKTTSAKGSLAAGDGVVFIQPLEGSYTRRLFYGTSAAKGSWLRWRASSTQAGTASVSIRNGANDRSFVQSFAVTTVPTDYSLFVPGDTTGTWATGSTAPSGANVGFCHAAGSTGQTSTLGAWQAGNFFAANTQSNMLDTVNRQLNITDVQWSQSSVLLPFEVIDYQQELAKCQRYWDIVYIAVRSNVSGAGALTSSGVYWSEKRAVPSATQIAAGISSNISSSGLSVVRQNGGRFEIVAAGAGDNYVLDRTFALSARF